MLTNKFIKKGAMFGLDARIALAIFGALSVISGAALYSAIQDSKDVAYYTQLQEFSKSVEHYMLDQGQPLPSHSATALDARYLVKNVDSDSNWRGPYAPCEAIAASDTYKFVVCNGGPFGNVGSYYVRPYADNTNFMDTCTSTNCDLWIFKHYSSIYNDVMTQVFDRLDEKFDGGNGRDEGNLKLYVSGSVVYLFVKIMPYESFI